MCHSSAPGPTLTGGPYDGTGQSPGGGALGGMPPVDLPMGGAGLGLDRRAGTGLSSSLPAQRQHQHQHQVQQPYRSANVNVNSVNSGTKWDHQPPTSLFGVVGAGVGGVVVGGGGGMGAETTLHINGVGVGVGVGVSVGVGGGPGVPHQLPIGGAGPIGQQLRASSERLPFFAQFHPADAVGAHSQPGAGGVGAMGGEQMQMGHEQQMQEGAQQLAAQQGGGGGGGGNNSNSTFFLDDVLGAGKDSERQQIEGTLLSFLN